MSSFSFSIWLFSALVNFVTFIWSVQLRESIHTHCWDMKLVSNSSLFLSILYIWLDRDAHNPEFEFSHFLISFQRNTCSNRYVKYSKLWFVYFSVLILFGHAFLLVVGVIKVIFLSVCLDFGRVRSCSIEIFGSRCFGSISCCFS